MKKSEAIARIVRMPGTHGIANSSIHFANVNSSKDVWWLDIPVAKLANGGKPNIKLLLYDQGSDKLFILDIPKTYFSDNLKRLVTRHDKKCISLELSTENTKIFRDVRSGGDGVNFSQFLKDTI